MHGIDVWVIGDDQPKSYDAIATDKLGVTIAAPGADCQTLLFCDVTKRVIKLIKRPIFSELHIYQVTFPK